MQWIEEQLQRTNRTIDESRREARKALVLIVFLAIAMAILLVLLLCV